MWLFEFHQGKAGKRGAWELLVGGELTMSDTI